MYLISSTTLLTGTLLSESEKDGPGCLSNFENDLKGYGKAPTEQYAIGICLWIITAIKDRSHMTKKNGYKKYKIHYIYKMYFISSDCIIAPYYGCCCHLMQRYGSI